MLDRFARVNVILSFVLLSIGCSGFLARVESLGGDVASLYDLESLKVFE